MKTIFRIYTIYTSCIRALPAKKVFRFGKHFFTGAAAAMLFTTCEKVENDPMAYYPSIKTVSAAVQPDGSVLVTGQIVSPGTDKVEMAGFCLSSTNPVPQMLDSQALAVIMGSTFTATYSSFPIKTKFYFRSWAANSNGYVYGNIISLDSIAATPIVAPCSPPMNTFSALNGNESMYSAGKPYNTLDGWRIDVSTNNTLITIVVGERPVTKTYTIAHYSPPGPNEIIIDFNIGGFTSEGLDTGQPVYINQLDTASWNVTFCNATFSGDLSGNATARFAVPY